MQLEKDLWLEYGGLLACQRPEGGGNPSQFPKDMLYPCPTGRNDRTAQQVGWPKARVWRRVAACRADIARATVSSQTRLQQRISLSAGTTQLDLSSILKSCLGQRRPSGKSGKQDANAEDRQPMQAALADNPHGDWYLRGNVNVRRMPRLETYENYISEHLLYLPPINLCKYYPCHSTLLQFYLFCKLQKYFLFDVPIICHFLASWCFVFVRINTRHDKKK